MILVPTEKQFDWRHAPIMLFTIVLLNLLAFFLYQSDDNEKIAKALAAYEQQDFFSKEWPAFERFLQERGETQKLADYKLEIAQDRRQAVAVQLLFRDDFYQYLQHHSREYFLPDAHDAWSLERSRLQGIMDSVSSFALGLRASAFRVTDLITYQFLHGDMMHLVGNMFFLVVCGFAVEAVVGHWRFLAFYLIAGCVAGAASEHARTN